MLDLRDSAKASYPESYPHRRALLSHRHGIQTFARELGGLRGRDRVKARRYGLASNGLTSVTPK